MLELPHPEELFSGAYYTPDQFVDAWDAAAGSKSVLVEWGREGDGFDPQAQARCSAPLLLVAALPPANSPALLCAVLVCGLQARQPWALAHSFGERLGRPTPLSLPRVSGPPAFSPESVVFCRCLKGAAVHAHDTSPLPHRCWTAQWA